MLTHILVALKGASKRINRFSRAAMVKQGKGLQGYVREGGTHMPLARGLMKILSCPGMIRSAIS
jgi:hypothetical protein